MGRILETSLAQTMKSVFHLATISVCTMTHCRWRIVIVRSIAIVVNCIVSSRRLWYLSPTYRISELERPRHASYANRVSAAACRTSLHQLQQQSQDGHEKTIETWKLAGAHQN
jgi:hypothetical protein